MEFETTSKIKDSGARTEFSTGAVRDIQEGKGRCDLLPLQILSEIFGDPILDAIGVFVDGEGESVASLRMAIKNFCERQYSTPRTRRGSDLSMANTPVYSENYYTAMLELSKHFEDGAKKYGEYNWQKGIPVSRYIDSAVRHYLKYKAGWTDEPHDRAFLWNLVCCLWTLENKPELNDLGKCE